MSSMVNMTSNRNREPSSAPPSGTGAVTLTAKEVAYALTGAVNRYVGMGVEEPIALRLVALENHVTINCIRAAMQIVRRAEQAS
jgi:hypothetical protein